MSKEEIREILKDQGDFVQIDNLTKFLDTRPAIDIKRFIFKRLTELYENAGMFSDAGINAENSAEASVTYVDKIKLFMKATELFVKASNFERADYSMKKALHNANESEKGPLYSQIKEFYKKQAQAYEKDHKRAHAVKFYEKLLTMTLFDEEKQEIKNRLLDLYQKLGQFSDYHMLKKG